MADKNFLTDIIDADLAEGKVTLKDMATGQQTLVAPEEIVARLRTA